MTRRVSPARVERGAILVQTALALIAVLAFGAFVIDYGVLWASRGQAQNAADAAALAGAVSMSYDGAEDREAAARSSASAVALSHRVWNQAPEITSITFPACPDGSGDHCIRVDVARTGLPTYFARLVGVNSQEVRATATAKAGAGNAVECLKPWAVADKWEEHRPVEPGTWTPESTFDRFDNKGVLLPGLVDIYRPPTDPSPTGFHPFNEDMTPTDDYGLRITLKIGDNLNPQQMSAGWFQPLVLSCPGGDCYREAIAGCAAGTFAIGQIVTTEPGNMIGPTKQGVDDLVALDPDAYWDTTTKTVEDSAFAISPRIVPVPVIDIQEYMGRDPTGRDTVTIVNIFGFFVVAMDGNDVDGYLCALPGKNVVGTPSLDDNYSFLRTIQLVR